LFPAVIYVIVAVIVPVSYVIALFADAGLPILVFSVLSVPIKFVIFCFFFSFAGFVTKITALSFYYTYSDIILGRVFKFIFLTIILGIGYLIRVQFV
jgi:hypothetical protein